MIFYSLFFFLNFKITYHQKLKKKSTEPKKKKNENKLWMKIRFFAFQIIFYLLFFCTRLAFKAPFNLLIISKQKILNSDVPKIRL